MPGRLFLTRPIAEVAEWLGAALGDLGGEPARQNISPGEEIIVCTPERKLTKMRWGLIPMGRKNARGRPVLETLINARSETLFKKSAFEGLRRGLVPADGWYEWTGEKRKKTAWAIKPKDGVPLAFAAVWDVWVAPGGRELPQVATVTCEPSADVRDIHHRMGVLLRPEQFVTWLSGNEDAAARLAVPLPDGMLDVTEATGVDWAGP